jgi:NADH-quinone oxidoreductase subunit B/C/D
MEGTAIRGTSVVPPEFADSRSNLMWTPAARRIELSDSDQALARSLQERFSDAVELSPATSDMTTFQVAENRIKDVLRFLKSEATPRYQRLEDLTAIDESARQDPVENSDFTMVYHLLSFEPRGAV